MSAVLTPRKALRLSGAGSVGDHELVERDGELARLDGAIEQAIGGEGCLVFVHGAAGIGKTALLAACAERARSSGLEVLAARGNELEREFPYGVVCQLFERRVRDVAGDERRRLFAGAAATAAEAILCDGVAAGALARGDGDFAAMRGLYWLVARIAADVPLMLVLDDAHWADTASLRFFNYLSNRLAGLSLLVIVARSDAPDGGGELLRTLAAAASSVLAPAVLTPAGSAQIVRRRMSANSSFAAACHESSGGNPFLLHELLSAVAIDGIAGDDAGAHSVRRLTPTSVSRAVFLRLARLPSGAIEFARAVAVLGDRVELSDAAALAGLPLRLAADLSDALAVAGFLEPELPLSFTHQVVLEAVAGDLGPGERAALHARAAELLHARGAGADQVAAHLSCAGETRQPWAIEVLREVARDASARGAPKVAVRHLSRALREVQTTATRASLLAQLGEAQSLAGDDPAVAISHLREACRLTADPCLLARATIVLARTILNTGDVVAAADALLQALDRADGLDDADRLRLEAELGSIGLLNVSSMAHVRRRLEAFGDVAGDSTEALLMLCNLAVRASQSGTADEAAALALRALADGRLLAAVGSDSLNFREAVWVLLDADRLDEAHAVCAAALADAQDRGSTWGLAACCAIGALTALRAGDVVECEAHARTALDLPEISGIDRSALYASLAFALVERGELDEAEHALQQGFVGEHLPVLTALNGGFYARGLLRIAQGRDEEALADLTEFGVRQSLCEVAGASLPWRVDAARTCMRLGRSEQAAALLADQEHAAVRWGTRTAKAIALHGHATAADGQEQLALLEAADELLARSPCRLGHARLLLDLGSALRRSGRRRDAQRRLAQAVTLAVRCGSTALATRANDELGILSTRPRRLQFSGVDSLTASERRIARMAAQGQSNPQIAQALFISTRTVENHLGRVYIKLAIKSRGQLPGALGESAHGPSASHPRIKI